MEAKFDVHGVLQIADNVRQKGSRFYLQAARRFMDSNRADLCRELANRLTGKSDLESQTQQKASTSRPRQKRDYVSTHPFVMADLGAFAAGGKRAMLTGRESRDGILKIAIIRTEYAIAFYRGLKDFVRDKAGIEMLEEIITEEKSHIVTLTKRLTSKKSPA